MYRLMNEAGNFYKLAKFLTEAPLSGREVAKEFQHPSPSLRIVSMQALEL